jgi:hypothetical protein
MSSTQSTASYQGAPSVLDLRDNHLTAKSLEEVKTWSSNRIIKVKCDNPQSNHDSGSYYYSDSQLTEGILGSGRQCMAHLRNREEQTLHRQGIAAVVRELKKNRALPAYGVFLEANFKIRSILGLPLSVGALKKELAKFGSTAAPLQAQPPPSRFTQLLFGKTKEKRKSVLENVKDDLTHIFKQKNGYQRIPGEDKNNQLDWQSNPLRSDFSYQTESSNQKQQSQNKRTLNANDFSRSVLPKSEEIKK